MSTRDHWQRVYEEKDPEQVSWYQEHPRVSLELIERAILMDEMKPAGKTRIVDIGGGASQLVDHLITREGFDVTLVDLAESALALTRRRLGEKASQVQWIAADLTQPLPEQEPFDLWHDRAVFHFMTTDADRRAYLENLKRWLRSGGVAIIATFGPEGPEKCSGFAVQRYSTEELSKALGEGYEVIESRSESHLTPWGSEQAFNYVVLRASESGECQSE